MGGGGRGGTHLISTPTKHSEKPIQFAPRHNHSAFGLFLPLSLCCPQKDKSYHVSFQETADMLSKGLGWIFLLCGCMR